MLTYPSQLFYSENNLLVKAVSLLQKSFIPAFVMLLANIHKMGSLFSGPLEKNPVQDLT